LITSRAVLDAAEQTGFRPEIVEKVLRLNGILGRLHNHPGSEGAWVLKGGTALNLFHLDVPRLSVDIDLNFVGSRDLEGMQDARPGFEGALTACCEREGCSVKRCRYFTSMNSLQGNSLPLYKGLRHATRSTRLACSTLCRTCSSGLGFAWRSCVLLRHPATTAECSGRPSRDWTHVQSRENSSRCCDELTKERLRILQHW
jgi:hypothetical protein